MKRPSWVLRSTVQRCDRLVKKNKDAYHIIRIYGSYFVVSTKFFQENIIKYCNGDIQHLKAQFYYDDVTGIKYAQAYAPKNTELTRLIDETNKLVCIWENIDLGIGSVKAVSKKYFTENRQLRKQIKTNIKQIKRQVNAGAN